MIELSFLAALACQLGLNWYFPDFIVASCFITPVVTGIAAVLLLYIEKRFILQPNNSLKNALRLMSLIYLVAVGVNIFSFFHSGVPLLGFDNLQLWILLLIALISLVAMSVLPGYENTKGTFLIANLPSISCQNISLNAQLGMNYSAKGWERFLNKQAMARNDTTACSRTSFVAEEDFCFSDASKFTLNESSQVRRGPIWQGNYPNAYPNQLLAKSRALLLNNITCARCDVRYGADRDSANLKNILEQLGFEVESHMDKQKEEMFRILQKFTASRKNEHAPMVLVFIGSHGRRDANQDKFIDTDGEMISVEEVVNLFTPNNAPLIKKETPKLFFFQFCRQNREATQTDSIMEQEEPHTFGWFKRITKSDTCSDSDPESVTNDPAQKYANMLFAFATAPGTAAIRDCSEGSWFVTALCKILIEHSTTEDLLSMLTMVNAAVMKKRGTVDNREVVQMCEVKYHLTEKVFMGPKEISAIDKLLQEHHKNLPESMVLYDETLKPNPLPDVHPGMHKYELHKGEGPVEKEKFIPSTQKKFDSHLYQHPVSFEEILKLSSQNRFIALVGPPGSGKTTLCKQLVKLKTNQSATILLRFMDLNYKQPLTYKQLFVDFLCPGLDKETKENVFKWMLENQDKCVFVFDGYDQALWSLENMKPPNVDYDTPLSVDELVANLCCRKFFKESFLIFTSRPHSMLKIPSELRPDVTVHVDDLSTVDMEKLFRALAGKRADELWKILSTKTPQLLSLCHNPLLLQFIVFAVLHQGLIQVKTVTEVFQTVLEQLRYSEHARNEDLTKLWEPFGKMAYEGMQEKTVVFTRKHLGDLDATVVQDIIIAFARKLGFPSQKLFDVDQLFYFSHQMLQEVFAAKYICEFMPDEEFNKIIPEVAEGGHWSMVRRFVCGLLLGDNDKNDAQSSKSAVSSVQHSTTPTNMQGKIGMFHDRLIEMMTTVSGNQIMDLLPDLQECSEDEKNFLASFFPVECNFQCTPISSTAACALADILPRLDRRIEGLSLMICDLNSDTLRVICGGISKMKHGIDRLDLSGNHLGEDAAIEIIPSCFKNVDSIILRACNISVNGSQLLYREVELLGYSRQKIVGLWEMTASDSNESDDERSLDDSFANQSDKSSDESDYFF